ncbi:MAG: hypothetical protein HY704_06345 [Gemmatimonadetes bacterium]|nr:hypothetical protein [Gemmatimonadota bacterium]
MDRSRYPTRRARFADGERDAVRDLTPADRLAMVWQLTLQAWAFKGEIDGEPRLRRDVGRVIRRGG